MTLLEVKNLEVRFPLRQGELIALNNVSFSLNRGERLGIVGESGAGKSVAAFSILNRDQRTFGHMLREAGYRTMVAGKWQLLGAEHYSEEFRGKGTWPADAGFDRYCLWQVDRLGSRYWNPLLNVIYLVSPCKTQRIFISGKS